MVNETWVVFKYRPDLYEISDLGKLRSKDRYTKLNKILVPGRVIKMNINRNGYEIFHVTQPCGSKKTLKMHRMVAEHFIPNPENKPQINHKDCNKLNNHVSNIEWCTAKENTNHAQANGRMKKADPNKRYIKKGRPIGIKKIVNVDTGQVFSHVKELSEKTGMGIKNLRRALSGERYNHTQYRYVGQESLILLPQPKEESVRKIAIFNLKGDYIGQFVYISQANQFVKCKTSDINDFLKGKRSHVRGYKFKEISKDGSFIEPTPFISKKPPLKPRKIPQAATPSKEIIKFEIDGTELQRFSSIGEAAKHAESDKGNFRKVLKGKIKGRPGYYKGFIYKYA